MPEVRKDKEIGRESPEPLRAARRLAWACGVVFLAAALAYVVVLHRYARHFEGKVSGFICLGDRFLSPDEVPEGVFQMRNSRGYDGQFFYFIARDPWIRGSMLSHIDVPVYRYRRIVYPVLAWALSLGRDEWLPSALVAVNLLALAAGTAWAALLLRDAGLWPGYALAFAFTSGALLCVLRDLSDLCAAAFLVGGFLAYRRGRAIPAAAGFAAACLARETMLPVLLVLAGDALAIQRKPRLVWVPTLALAPVLAWHAYISLRLHVPSWRGGQGNFGSPLSAVWQHAQHVFGDGRASASEQLYLGLFLAASALTLGLAVREVIRRRTAISLGQLGFALMPAILSRRVWVEPWSYGRVLLPSATFLLLAFAESRDRLYLAPLGIHAALWGVILFWQRIV